MSIVFEYDEDLEEEEVVSEEIVSIIPKDFVDSLRILAKQYMIYFFADKEMHCGGKITESFLFQPRRLYAVMNMNFCKAVDKAYNCMKSDLDEDYLQRCVDQGKLSPDVEKVIETLDMLGAARVPQQFLGGMLLLYLELCEGVKIEL